MLITGDKMEDVSHLPGQVFELSSCGVAGLLKLCMVEC